jgi:ribosomal-protein-alanine N-acetyltransferase
MNNFIISTPRLGLRRWIDTDIDPFKAMNKDAEVMRYFPRILTDNETHEMVNRISSHFDKNKFGLFAVENKLTKQFIGYTGFAAPSFESFFTPCIEIGWRFQRAAWGHGFATEAAKACLNYGFGILGFDKVVSFTSTINLRSENVMKRIWMTKTGEFDHPNIDSHSILCRHLLYEITSNRWMDLSEGTTN